MQANVTSFNAARQRLAGRGRELVSGEKEPSFWIALGLNGCSSEATSSAFFHTD